MSEVPTNQPGQAPQPTTQPGAATPVGTVQTTPPPAVTANGQPAQQTQAPNPQAQPPLTQTAQNAQAQAAVQDPANSQAPSEPTDAELAARTSLEGDALKAALAKTRDGEAAARVKVRELEQQIQQMKTDAELAGKSALEQAEAKYQQQLRANENLQAKLNAEISKQSLYGKVVNVDAAYRLIDDDKHRDVNGNVDLGQLLSDYPFLNLPDAGSSQPQNGQAAQPTQAPAPANTASPPPPNHQVNVQGIPAADNTAVPVITRTSQIPQLTPEQFERHRIAIYAGINNGTIIRDD